MLRSDTLMLDNKLFPLNQERVTSLTFNTEHSSEHLDTDDPDDDDEHCEELLIISGTGRGAGTDEEDEGSMMRDSPRSLVGLSSISVIVVMTVGRGSLKQKH